MLSAKLNPKIYSEDLYFVLYFIKFWKNMLYFVTFYNKNHCKPLKLININDQYDNLVVYLDKKSHVWDFIAFGTLWTGIILPLSNKHTEQFYFLLFIFSLVFFSKIGKNSAHRSGFFLKKKKRTVSNIYLYSGECIINIPSLNKTCRAESIKFFRWYFGRNNFFTKTFWN